MKLDETVYDPDTHKEKEHKIMTMEDVANELEKDFAEEIRDAKRYLCMAKVADGAGNKHDAHYLLEIAKDEYTHARFIHGFMEHHDMWMQEEYEKSYEKLEEEMAQFF